jgi:imidazolonepropionase-like amidohydrolase
MRIRLASFVAYICFATSMASGQELTVIHAGTLLANPDLPPLEEQTIVVEGDRVIAVSEGYLDAGEFANREVRVLDLTDQFVLPGLIDTHVHLTLNGFAGDFSRVSNSDLALRAVENARLTVESGITTVRDLGAFKAEPIFAVRDAIERGAIVGPRIIAAGESISATAGHGDLRGLRPDIADLIMGNAICDGADDCRRAVRDQYKMGAETIKVHATGGGADPNGKRYSKPEMFDDELRAVVETAHRLNLVVAAHAHGTEGIKAALRAGVDSVEHSSWIDDEIVDMYLESGAYMVPTAYLQDFFLARDTIPEEVQDERRKNVALMHPKLSEAMKRGVNVAMGTDAGIMPHGENAHEIIKYVELGMTPSEAIRTATTNAARLLEMESEIGTVQVGGFADLVAVDGDPLADIEELLDVGFVMQSGRVVKYETE